MTRSPAKRGSAWAVASCLAGLALVGMFVWQHGESIEHGNRLFHEGRVEQAEQVYRNRAEPELSRGVAVYNLGTALLALDSPDAERYLRLATEAPDSAAAQRAHYNLGLRFLTRVADVSAPDSAVGLLASAVGSNRAALRLDPSDADALWNLALAQHMLDSLMEIAELDGPLSDEEETARAETEGGIILPRVARLGPPRGREREALAGEDPGALSPTEAISMVENRATDDELLIRGILWSQRPDVTPWAEPYPGGDW